MTRKRQVVTPPGSDVLLERLLTYHPKLVDLSLGRMHRLLAALDHPEKKLPPVVHVTGTNGKGSVLAFLRAMLEAADQRVHVYTSPHLVRFHERIRLADGLIAEDALADILARCEKANDGEPITFFEITTAAAFVAFSESPADIVLLENGLGGRLDATNVVERPLLTGITPVDMDHQQFLGDTLEKIAFEKAGIIKPHVPCVLGPQHDAALKVIRDRAEAVGAPLVPWEDDWTTSLPRPSLPGPHQKLNAAHAAALARRLEGFVLSDTHIHVGIQQATWPARLQRLSSGPIIDALPPGWEVWLDGGHNPAAGVVIAEHIADDWTDGRSLYMIAGMISTKDPVGYFQPLARHVRRAVCVSIPNEKAGITGHELAALATEAGVDASHSETAINAAQVLGSQHSDAGPARLLIAGSLYFAGHILADHR